MKIKDAIEMANLMENGNVMPTELAILFLSELDGMIQSDIMLYAPEEIVSYTDEDQELILRPPHDKLYVHYLVMMIRNQQQEYEGYQNSQESVDEKLETFRRWYVQHYRPADTGSRSYSGGTSADAFGFAYLSAYGLAVKHGYTGTEEEWLESLHGEKGDTGDAARMRYDEDREMIQWGVGDSWYDLFTLAELRDPAVDDVIAKVEAAVETAREHAHHASVAAADAAAYEGAAERAADSASAMANQAGVMADLATGEANRAAGGAEAALDQAQAATASANRAQQLVDGASAAAQSAAISAGRAEDAAKRAEEAAAGAGGSGGIAEESDPTVPAWAKQPQKPAYTAQEVGADPAGKASEVVDDHNLLLTSHADIRNAVEALRNRLNALADSDDATLDQLSEIVDYIKSNKSLIDAVTTSKVNVADIVDNLVTNVSNKPLSAAMGVALASDIDSVRSSLGGYLPRQELTSAVEYALDEAKKSGEFDGEDGRGIKSIVRTSGNGAAGTVDTYTITYTDDTTGTYQVRNGANGTNGADGADGDDGITPHIGGNGNWYLGDTDTGVKAQGADGKDGADGADGVGIARAEQITTSTADGGSNVFEITLTNGASATFTVKNGSTGGKGDKGDKGDTGETGGQGPQGEPGADGKTPVKGVDYYTEADKTEMVQAVITALPTYAGEVM